MFNQETLPVIDTQITAELLSNLEQPQSASAKNSPEVTKILEEKHCACFLCEYCPFMCLNEGNLTEHVTLVHPLKKKRSQVDKHQCPGCSNVFFHKISLESHLIHDHSLSQEDSSKVLQIVLHTNKKTSIVDKRSENVAQKLLESTKIEKLTDIKILNDPVTNEIIFIDNKSPIDDAADDADDDGDDAGQDGDDCVKDSSTDDEPDKHEPSRCVLQAKLYKCKNDKCRLQMQDPEKLDYHVKCHQNDHFVCPEPQCGAISPHWKTFVGHLWRTHRVDMELHKCDLCEYRTHSYSKLHNTHRRIHSADKPFACDIDECHKMFKNMKQMRNHRDLVHKSRATTSYACADCKKDFSQRRQLKSHVERVHKKLKPHACTLCAFSTATKGALKMHVRVHTGEKPFKCEFCEYATSDHNSLRRHRFRHNDSGDKPKPYNCPHCSYASVQASTYKMHLKMKHPGLDKSLVFACKSCPFRSVNREYFTAHVRNQHGSSRSSSS